MGIEWHGDAWDDDAWDDHAWDREVRDGDARDRHTRDRHTRDRDEARRTALAAKRKCVMRYDHDVLTTTAAGLDNLERDPEHGHLVLRLPATRHRVSQPVELSQVLYATLALHEPMLRAAEDFELPWAVPVTTAHRRGTQRRRRPPPGHPGLHHILGLDADGAGEPAADATVVTDPGPPPF